MQFNKYIKHFYPSEPVNSKAVSKYILGFNRFIDEWNNDKPLPIGTVTFEEFLLPFNKNFTEEKHYNILYIIAQQMGVKLMWRDILERNALEYRKGIWIIGQLPYIKFTSIVFEYYFRIYYELYKWLTINAKGKAKRAGYVNVRRYASNQCALLEDSTYILIKNKLELDRKYEMYLENVIKEMFKLDYKNFNTNKSEYYHAISGHYHHKRMLL